MAGASARVGVRAVFTEPLARGTVNWTKPARKLKEVSPSDPVEQAYLARLEERDSVVFGLSDTHDMKASIALVVIVFLADQSGDLLSGGTLSHALYGTQVVSCALLFLAGAFSLVAMWPRTHHCENVDEWREWIDRLRTNHPDDDDGVLRAFQAGRVQNLLRRIGANNRVCSLKSRLVIWSFAVSTLALATNLVTLLVR